MEGGKCDLTPEVSLTFRLISNGMKGDSAGGKLGIVVRLGAVMSEKR